MTTLTLELTGGQAWKWAQKAERLKITPEQPITQSVGGRSEGRRRSVSQAIKRIIREK